MDGFTFARASLPEEYAICADIWLQASIVAHHFIDKEFWKSNVSAMTEHYLPASVVMVAYDADKPVAFSATVADTLEALFVLPAQWSKKRGQNLLQLLFSKHTALNLAVYQKNQRAVAFYQYMGFSQVKRLVCPHTGELEISMRWVREGNYAFRIA